MKKDKLIGILLISALSGLVVTWFRGDFLINHGDQGFPVSPLVCFKNYAPNLGLICEVDLHRFKFIFCGYREITSTMSKHQI